MHLWPSLRIRDSFKQAYIDKIERNLHRMQQHKQRLRGERSSDPLLANGSSDGDAGSSSSKDLQQHETPSPLRSPCITVEGRVNWTNPNPNPPSPVLRSDTGSQVREVHANPTRAPTTLAQLLAFSAFLSAIRSLSSLSHGGGLLLAAVIACALGSFCLRPPLDCGSRFLFDSTIKLALVGSRRSAPIVSRTLAGLPSLAVAREPSLSTGAGAAARGAFARPDPIRDAVAITGTEPRGDPIRGGRRPSGRWRRRGRDERGEEGGDRGACGRCGAVQEAAGQHPAVQFEDNNTLVFIVDIQDDKKMIKAAVKKMYAKKSASLV
ncbi:hypothetical protein BHM03_00017776 [Ensete ventricosum]|nr:hypothetical protein BHM03_00017776 [Ensete ventricosum]